MEWTARQNIEHFERLIASEADPDKLARLKELLQEERSRLAAFLRSARE